ncbi:MAG: FG-GAP repeat protein [Microgenomates group bacterium GW2011_GWC1_39_7b]|uniref:FG-GAP repeat protein n=2 Tax=Candidatus Woeseibacteriota TaxID=1752722 RepID=A0A0G0LV45_9BACT|nr:MAG: FG-GAP repeat protein [Candidatus Woesebacteria bacterium GW2011_GWB1_39_10]KKR27032.1 MAG: FG-GAP repeat protein [Microgenomates group bacterium GW2011_GWC1_39_7b]
MFSRERERERESKQFRCFVKSLFFIFLFLFFSSFVFPSKILASTTYNMATTTNWNIRIDGANASDLLTYSNATNVDLDNDGNRDIIVGARWTDYNSRADSGSIYIIYSSLWKGLTGTGNTIDLANPNNYNIRIDGAAANDMLGFSAGVFVQDLNGNGKFDLLIPSIGSDNNSRSGSGSVFVIYDTLLDDYSGTGNTIDLASSNNFNIRFDGAAASDNLSTKSVDTTNLDIDGDNKQDIILASVFADNNSRNESGSVYYIANTVFGNLLGTGNTIDLATTSNFTIRYDGAATGDNFGRHNDVVSDLNDNNKLDLIIGARQADYNSRTGSGSVYVIYASLIDDYSGTGNIVDMNTTSNYNLRYDGAIANDQLSGSLKTGNIDGKKDLLIGTYLEDNNSRTDSGSIYIIKNALIASYSGTGNNIDLATSTNYSIRYDGAVAGDGLGYFSLLATDYNSNGIYDILVVAYRADQNSRSDSGSLYVIYDSLIASYSGTGNNIDLATGTNYSIRYDGPTASSFFSGHALSVGNLYGNGKMDILVDAGAASFNSRTNSGSLYIIYNFPHTIDVSVTSSPLTSNVKISGTVSAPNSTTAVAGVEYSIDDNYQPATSWTSCSGTTKFDCDISNLSTGNHLIYVRAYDTNGSYTPQSHYIVYKVGSFENESSDSNCKADYKYCINAGPNYTKNTSILQTFVNNSWAGTIIPSYSSHDDMYVTIKRQGLKDLDTSNIPYPWSQGLNTYSDIFKISSVSAFNGFPINKTDKPFTVQLPYDKTKLNGVSPTVLKVSYFDSESKKWKTIKTPIVVDWIKNMVSTTTKNFSLYALTYPSQTRLHSDRFVVQTSPPTSPVSTKPEAKVGTPKPSNNHCFLWWCW